MILLELILEITLNEVFKYLNMFGIRLRNQEAWRLGYIITHTHINTAVSWYAYQIKPFNEKSYKKIEHFNSGMIKMNKWSLVCQKKSTNEDKKDKLENTDVNQKSKVPQYTNKFALKIILRHKYGNKQIKKMDINNQ